MFVKDEKGTSFRAEWPESLRKVISDLILRHRTNNTQRVRVVYRDGATQEGHMSRTGGNIHEPMLLFNKDSTTGHLLYGDPIRIEASATGRHNRKVFWDMARDEPVMFVMTS